MAGAFYVAARALDGTTWLGVTDSAWVCAVVEVAVAHQVVAWFVWRAQLV